MKKILLGIMFITFLGGILTFSFASAHPGNTDKKGCHTCKTNCPKWGLKYGQYHCHNTKGRIR